MPLPLSVTRTTIPAPATGPAATVPAARRAAARCRRGWRGSRRTAAGPRTRRRRHLDDVPAHPSRAPSRLADHLGQASPRPRPGPPSGVHPADLQQILDQRAQSPGLARRPAARRCRCRRQPAASSSSMSVTRSWPSSGVRSSCDTSAANRRALASIRAAPARCTPAPPALSLKVAGDLGQLVPAAYVDTRARDRRPRARGRPGRGGAADEHAGGRAARRARARSRA